MISSTTTAASTWTSWDRLRLCKLWEPRPSAHRPRLRSMIPSRISRSPIVCTPRSRTRTSPTKYALADRLARWLALYQRSSNNKGADVVGCVSLRHGAVRQPRQSDGALRHDGRGAHSSDGRQDRHGGDRRRHRRHHHRHRQEAQGAHPWHHRTSLIGQRRASWRC